MPDLSVVLAATILWLVAGPVLGLTLILSAEELVSRSQRAPTAMLGLLLTAAGIVIGGPILWLIMYR